MSEQVLVFPEGCMECFSEEFWKNNYSSLGLDVSGFWIKCLPEAFFMPRDKAEKDPSVKQIIPYIILYRRETSGKEFLTYKRTKHGGEGRLYDKHSIGIGGHINKEDVINGFLNIENCISRELSEEITILESYMSRFERTSYGIVYDPSNDVGKVHFGIAITMRTEFIGVLPNEDSLGNLEWKKKDQLEELNTLENWSKIVIGNM